METRPKFRFFAAFGTVLVLLTFSMNPAFSQTAGDVGVFSREQEDVALDSEGLEDISAQEDLQDPDVVLQSERDSWPESDEAENQAETERELQLTPREIRGRLNKGFALGLFPTRPWQFITLSANFLSGAKGMWVTSAGIGGNTFSGERRGWHYQIETHSKAVDCAYQWFLSEAFPLSVGTGIGFVTWNGIVNPSGGDINDAARDEAALRSGFTGTGVYGFANVHLSWIRSSGFFFEYNVVGLGDTRVFELSMTKDAGASRGVVHRNLSAGQSWGFINFKIGWFL